MSFTPHGSGFSFVDGIEFIGGEPAALRATKYLSPALPFFADHFPGFPTMPGVLIIEMTAQAAGALWWHLIQVKAGSAEISQQPYFLAQVQDFRFRRAAVPGDTLTCVVSLVREFGTLAQFVVEVSDGGSGEPIAGGKITLARSGGR